MGISDQVVTRRVIGFGECGPGLLPATGVAGVVVCDGLRGARRLSAIMGIASTSPWVAVP
ncbi:hypothetical protein [Micromonospora carbonacea]|uniref:hypothetical protein n=1 Tax=Micromonospora carbonacea TaxID=47853 RepID=UPI0009434B11|nr:hypothetical protein [Micromonospora carbonacea]